MGWVRCFGFWIYSVVHLGAVGYLIFRSVRVERLSMGCFVWDSSGSEEATSSG